MKKLINASCESNIRTVLKEHVSLENLHFDAAVNDDDSQNKPTTTHVRPK